jgi:predicted alpha/beta superfamily hydrolase
MFTPPKRIEIFVRTAPKLLPGESALYLATTSLNNINMFRIYFFRVFLLFLTTTAFFEIAGAQDTLIAATYNGKIDSLNSAILNQKRFIQVFVPPGYKPGSTTKYDVLYVLDGGNWNTGLIMQIQRFIEAQGLMPSTIVVSVMGVDRNVELTPTVLKSWNAPTGGADKFLAYIKDELIPYVDKHYPSNGDNTLWGHSLGGMFVIYALLKEPGIFKAYIGVDPSLWWDHCYVPKLAAAKLQALSGSNITLFLTGREGPNFHEMKIDTMDLVLKKTAPVNLTWKVVTYPGETHSSVRLKSIYDGLKFTYDGYTTGIEFLPMNGIVLKDTPYKIWFSDDTTRVHYTLDGTVPTASSPQVQHEVTLNGAATVTYKRIGNKSIYDKTATGHFIIEKMPTPAAKLKNAKQGGFNYSYYERDQDSWPDLKNLKPLRTGVTNKDFENTLPRENNYALLIDGFIEIKEDGYHVFYVRAAKGSKLWLGERLLMKWDESREDNVYIVPLSKGFYPLRMEYFNEKEKYNLLLFYLTPGRMATADPNPIPVDVEYNK